MNTFIQIAYWAFHFFLIMILCFLFSNYGEHKRHAQTPFYVLLLILSTLVCLGPVYRIFCAVDKDLEQKQENFTTNATLPTGMYYLGCEIVDIEEYTDDEGNFIYIYDFMAMDDKTMAGYTYSYSTYEKLEYDSKYLLTMDGMGTTNVADDEIAIVWARVWN